MALIYCRPCIVRTGEKVHVGNSLVRCIFQSADYHARPRREVFGDYGRLDLGLLCLLLEKIVCHRAVSLEGWKDGLNCTCSSVHILQGYCSMVHTAEGTAEGDTHLPDECSRAYHEVQRKKS